MANCVKCRFSLNLQLFSVVLKSAPVKYVATDCPWDSHQIRRSCTSMSLWWQNNPSLWLSWTVNIPKWVSILRHAACAPSDAKLLEGSVHLSDQQVYCLILEVSWYFSLRIPEPHSNTHTEYITVGKHITSRHDWEVTNNVWPEPERRWSKIVSWLKWTGKQTWQGPLPTGYCSV